MSIIPSARLTPICLGNRLSPPAKAANPTFGSGKAKTAFSDAIIKSQARAISKPPPIATPLTAAITGLTKSNLEVSPAKPRGIGGLTLPSACHRKSFPALKARPSPVIIATHNSSSFAYSSKTSANSRFAGGCSAFKRSGRLIVTVSIRFNLLTLQNSVTSYSFLFIMSLANPKLRK